MMRLLSCAIVFSFSPPIVSIAAGQITVPRALRAPADAVNVTYGHEYEGTVAYDMPERRPGTRTIADLRGWASGKTSPARFSGTR